MSSTKDYLNENIRPLLHPLIKATLMDNPSDPVNKKLYN